MVLKGLIFVSFYFGGLWLTWKTNFGYFSLGGCGELKKDRFWITGRFGFVKSQPIELKILLCQCVWRLSYGPECMAELTSGQHSYAVRLHHHCCQCWHHCLLSTTLLIMWLMSVSLYVAYILAYFPLWCTLSTLGMGHIYGIWVAYLLLAHIWQ